MAKPIVLQGDGIFQEPPPIERPASPAFWRIRLGDVISGNRFLSKKEAQAAYNRLNPHSPTLESADRR